MKKLILISLMFLAACAPKKQSDLPSNEPVNAAPIAKNTYCGDTLILTLGAVFKVDVTGGISIVPDGTYTRPQPFCQYSVIGGQVVGGQ